ncbi:thioredoxin-like domain-containing protein [Mariniblastus fucicola]|uniref:Thiol-disulfide oxidoreductase n=1 Tax=Mariniblastus fucicola TaxID=980251 RepID=A0A5B9P7P8_9BACT|nr:thioredoxin-like domain-containing protein [Mariniblastus fucicola]QEG21529.1 hypothetical protein MFFC18_13850 [Mariniblastus fucicola]
MNRFIPYLLAFGALLPSSIVCADDKTDVGDVPAVELVSIRGAQNIVIEQQPEHELTVLCFLGTECPLAKLYAGRLEKFSKQFDKVRFVGISSNVQDSVDEVQQYIDRSGISFEFAKDYDNRFADQLKVTRTPEVVVFDSQRKIVYRGRIDDQYLPGVSRSSADRQDLKIAIENALAGKAIEVAETEPAGCLLGRKRESAAEATVTFANQVSRVLQRNCVECHRAGEIGPFSLETYEEAIGWADMMLEVIEEQRMPPWHADESVGKFANARNMSVADKQLLREWVDQGTPMGDAALLPQQIEYVSGWRLPREPDRVVEMSKQPYKIPADETVEYQYFVVDPNFTKDRWVSAAEVVPGNRSVVHHSIVFIRPPDGERARGVGWLAAYVPGQTPLSWKSNRARFVPKGSRLVFQMHYTPNGTPQTDVTKVGLVFADESAIEHELMTVMALDQEFEIPPFAASHEVALSRGRLPRDGTLLSVSPHMHYRGKSFVSSVTLKDKTDQPILSVPRYDFNWQHRYELAEPIELSEVRRLQATVEFDNSKENPFNPDPSKLVSWGDQTWEEMAVAFYDIAVPHQPNDAAVKNSESQNLQAEPTIQARQLTEDQLARVDEIERKYFERFDKDNDGFIVRGELPRAVRTWGFNAYDKNGDGKLTRDEVREQARIRVK